MPFRRRQPDYQRRWRWGGKLREIRAQIGQLGVAVLSPLRSLMTRAQQLASRAMDSVQTGVLAGESLERAVQVVRNMVAALEQLESSHRELQALGL